MESRQQRLLPVTPLAFALISACLWACSSSSGDGPGTGGTPSLGGTTAGSGGRVATGGSSSAGGSVGTGGNLASGGSAVSGGTKGTGGAPEAGGSTGTAGAKSGGATAAGGSSSGGVAAGGSSGGGSSAKGGSQAGGSSPGGAAAGGSSSGGSSAGGSGAGGTGAGGSAGSQGKGSPGCNSSNPLKSGTFTETIDGAARKYILDVPTGYDTTKPYRMIFVWHPLGGSADQVVGGGYDGLKALANNSTIFVAPNGLNGSNSEASGNGWWNVNGVDMKFLTAMLEKLNGNLCVDQTRIFSTGFSFGGMMTYTVGFEFNVFRALAPCSGKVGVIPMTEKYTDPVPIMAFHGNADTFVATALGRQFFDKYAARNKCGTQTKPVAPSPCVELQGCVAQTIWCEFSGGHNTWSEEPQAIWKFFAQF